jgi:hypothetical protein
MVRGERDGRAGATAGGADYKGIQPGTACFEPITMVTHTSYAFNDYFQRKLGPLHGHLLLRRRRLWPENGQTNTYPVFIFIFSAGQKQKRECRKQK